MAEQAAAHVPDRSAAHLRNPPCAQWHRAWHSLRGPSRYAARMSFDLYPELERALLRLFPLLVVITATRTSSPVSLLAMVFIPALAGS